MKAKGRRQKWKIYRIYQSLMFKVHSFQLFILNFAHGDKFLFFQAES